MKEEAKEEKVEDKIKNDVVINSSLERTRRLLKSRTKVEAGTAIKQDPAAKLRDRLKKIKEMKEAKVTFDICLIFSYYDQLFGINTMCSELLALEILKHHFSV